MPSIAGIPASASQSDRLRVARWFDTIADSSRTTKPATHGDALSMSSGATP